MTRGARRLLLEAPWPVRLAVLGIALTCVYHNARVRQAGDSHYTVLLSQTLLEERTFDLSGAFVFPLDPERYPGLSGGDVPYQVMRERGKVLGFFPPGTAVLTVPLVGALRALGLSAREPDGAYSLRGELRMERFIAAILAALYVVIVYATARRFLGEGASLLVALAVAFGTPVWSTASRALWTHDWLLILVGAAIFLVAGRDRGWPGYLAAGLLAGAAFAVRPTAVVSLGGIGALGFLASGPPGERLRRLLATLAGAGVPVAMLCAFSLSQHGALLPPYYRGRLGLPAAEALLGTLVSPSRGLLVFVPVLAWVALVLARRSPREELRTLVVPAAAVCAATWLVVSSFPHWWGGKCYGPRLMTDALPWMALLGILAVKAFRESPRASPAEAWLGAALLGASVLLNTAGAQVRASNPWNDRPADVDREPSRLWDWRDPQFLAVFRDDPGQ